MKPTNILKKLAPYIILLLALAIYFPTIVFKNQTFISSGMVLSDYYLFNYPLKSLMHNSLLNSASIPYWTDLIGNGYPIFAEGQMGALYPFHLLFFSLPFETITLFNSNLILHYALSSIFIYLYLSKYIKSNRYISLAGAFVFTYSGYMLTHLHQLNIILVITYIPLNFYLIEKIFELNNKTKKLTYILLSVLITLVLYAQITAGHIEMVYYNFLFTAIYTALRLIIDPSVRKSLAVKICVLLASLALSISVALPQIQATYELVKFSQREQGLSYEHSTGALWPIETMVLFVNPKAYDVYRKEPGYSPTKSDTVNIGAVYPYVGILPLLLTAISISALFSKNKNNLDQNDQYQQKKKMWIALFLSLLVLTYVYTIGRSTQLFAVVWELIPGLKYFRFPIKALYIIELSLAVLSTIGLQEIYDFTISKTISQKTLKNTKSSQSLAKSDKNSQANLVHDQDSIGKKAVNKSIAVGMAALLISFIYADLWINNRTIQPTIPSDDWLKTPEFAKYIKEQESLDSQNGFVNWRSYSHGTNNIDYSRVFDFKLQKELTNILHIDFNMVHGVALNKEWAVLFLQRQTELNKFNTTIDFDKKELGLPEKMKKSLDLQSVRFLLTDIPIIHPDLKQVKEITLENPVGHVVYLANSIDSISIPVDKLYIFENLTYYPRINLTPRSKAINLIPNDKTASNILETVLNPEFNPTISTVVENAPYIDPSDNQVETSNSNYKIISYNPENIKLSITSDVPVYLNIQDTYYPGWVATVDEQPTTIYKANYAFKAVAVDSGTHTVELSFKPDYLKSGGIIQKVGWGIIISLLLFITLTLLMNKFKNKDKLQK